MAADLDARPSASEVSKVEFEGQGGLNLPSCEDPPMVGGDCNGIVHDSEQRIDGEAKDDGDGSYVFVDGADTVSDGPVDAESLLDPTETTEGVAIVKEKTVPEMNVGSLHEDTQVKIEELRMEQRGNTESPTDETAVSSSKHDLSSESSQWQSNGDGAEKSYAVEEKNKLEAAAMVEGDQEPQILQDGACELELHQPANEEIIEGKNKLEAAITVEEKLELPESANEEKIEEENKSEAAVTIEEKHELPVSASGEKVEEENNLEAAVTVEGKHELPQSTNEEKTEEENKSEAAVTIDEKLELPQSSNEDKTGEENNLEAGVIVEEKHESELMVTGAVEPMVHQLSNTEAQIEAWEYYQSNDPNAVESNLNQLDNCEEKVEEINKVKSNEETEKNQFDDEEEKVEEQSELDSSADVGVDQDSEIVDLEAIGTELDHRDSGEKEKGKVTAVIAMDKPTEQLEQESKPIMDMAAFSLGDVQLESNATEGADGSGKSEPIFPVEEIVSKVEVTHYSEEVHESRATDHEIETKSEYKIMNESVEDSKNFAHSAGDLKSKIVFGDISAENLAGLHASPAKFSALKPEVRNSSIARDKSTLSCSVNCEKSESKIESGPIENGHYESTIPVDDVEIESQTMNGSLGSCDNLPAGPVDDPQMNCKTGNITTARNKDMQDADDVKEGSLLLDVSVPNGESMPECINNVIDVEDEGSPSVSGDSDGKQIFEEVDGNEGIESNGNSPPPPENSTTDSSEGHKVDEEVAKRPFFLIRIPRYFDDKIRNEIGLAQLQVDEKTRSRDAIRSTIQLKRATCNEYRDKFEASRSEERAARDVFNAKRQEMDSVQSVINRMKNATSIDDIDERIQSMEHRIEHETVPLKEEKQLIREIKQLKNLREQLYAGLGKQAEVQPTSEQRDRIEERFKLLKQELDSARNEVLRAEGITREAKRTYFDENEKLKELQGQFRAADDLRQEAYKHLQNLKKLLYDKNKYFRMYKEDVRKAEDYAFRGDKEALQHLCVNQVETVMDLWNKNDEFRNEYVRCNMNSTLRRFRTLDGRHLGPDEEPPLLHSAVDEKLDNTVLATGKMNSTSLFSTSDQGTSALPLGPQVADINSLVNKENKSLKADMKSVVNQEQRTPMKSKKVIEPIALENSSATVSGREGAGEKAEEVNNHALEEEELATKAEELRKEEAAATLKEQQRLEEKAKAKEAEERKKRNAEKAQARAELRAQKEAELKEKVREKRARKKERKRAAAAKLTNGVTEEVSASSADFSQPETTHESEVKEKPTTVAKRPQKPFLTGKQTKTRALPPPLRSRGKRSMQPWMWVLLVVLAVLALIFMGNGSYSFKFVTRSFGF